MSKMLKGVLVNVKDNDAEVLKIEDELENFHRIIDCECIDIVSRQIGGKYYDIVCDDEGLYRQPRISAVDKNEAPMLVGNLFIVGHANSNGDLTSLTDKDIENIQKHVFVAKWDDGKTTPMVVGVEY